LTLHNTVLHSIIHLEKKKMLLGPLHVKYNRPLMTVHGSYHIKATWWVTQDKERLAENQKK